MNKLTVGLLLSSSLLFACGCIDMGTAPNLGSNSVSQYKQQDRELAQEINEIAEDIRESHRKYEYESSKRAEDTKLLLAKQLELEKEILFNAVMINKIQSLINNKRASENILDNERVHNEN